MFWADRIADQIKKEVIPRVGAGKPILIRDEKTASGRVHIGSMRGVAIHGVVAKALSDIGVANEFRYEINDFDPFDGLPTYISKEIYEPWMGGQLYKAPTPEGDAPNYAEHYGKEFEEVITDSGFTPNFYRSSELYLSGKMDEAIKLILQNADRVVAINKEVSGSQKEVTSLPLSVICENCGKVSTTQATDFDGETVSYVCSPTAVAWAKGCGHAGRVSPFGGKAKLPWKPEWAAKWFVLGVDVEGAGKDHSTKGGARDVANKIAEEIFKIKPPFDIPYEFFLVGGKKMSSSKGRGGSAREIADLVPPKILRLALLGKDYNQAFNFDAEGETIPTLFDQYDKLAENYKGGVRDDYSRLFEIIENKQGDIEVPFLMRFSQVAFAVQMPHIDIYQAAEELKGEALTELDRSELDERAHYAKNWLIEYAPEKYRFVLQETLPQSASELSPLQKSALKRIKELLEVTTTPEELHTAIHNLKTELGIAPQDLFSSIYIIFLDKKEGPKAGWFLATLDRAFALSRLEEASA